jgi:hypothetical protein
VKLLLQVLFDSYEQEQVGDGKLYHDIDVAAFVHCVPGSGTENPEPHYPILALVGIFEPPQAADDLVSFHDLSLLENSAIVPQHLNDIPKYEAREADGQGKMDVRFLAGTSP